MEYINLIDRKVIKKRLLDFCIKHRNPKNYNTQSQSTYPKAWASRVVPRKENIFF